jgi:hypothetical protein|tara:strand:+ start:898 stop:1761 length:864 start_codon:yes stop_codon:yes gene_type:complete
MISCPNCGADAKIGDKKCDFCGSKFERTVAKGVAINVTSSHCPFCKISLNRDKSDDICKGCGKDIRFDCSKCNSSLFIRTKFCKSCGTDVSTISNAITEKDPEVMSHEINHLLDRKAFDTALHIANELVAIDKTNFDYKFFLLKAYKKKIDFQRSIHSGHNLYATTVSKFKMLARDIINNSNNPKMAEDVRTNYHDPDYVPPKQEGCFVATAVFNDYDHPIVLELRGFRDNYLSKRFWGKSFIKTYYKYGPYPARLIKKSFLLRKFSYYLIIKPLTHISRMMIVKSK